MQIVIKIPDEKYERLVYQDIISLRSYVENGIVLSKGHKIIDAYALQEHLALVPMEDRTYREAVEIIDRFPSILEADKMES
jgi:hypothetical protein